MNLTSILSRDYTFIIKLEYTIVINLPVLGILCSFLFEAEPCMTETAGLHFVDGTSAQTVDKHDRKAMRSYAARASTADRQAVQLQSWISPDRELWSFKKVILEEEPTPESIL
jgi:hypothetical protein